MEDSRGGFKEWSYAKAKIKKHEKNILHPYLDSSGFMTIGIGAMIPSKDDFLKLDLLHEQPDDPGKKSFRHATQEEKGAVWDNFQPAINKNTRRAVNYRAEYYANRSKLHLPQHEVDRLLDIRLGNARDQAIKLIGAEAWSRLTVPQRAAAIDIEFNTGRLNTYKEFIQAAKDGDVVRMAQESLVSTDPDDDKKTNLRHHWARSRDKFCDINGYGRNKCAKAFDIHMNNQTLFRKTTDKDRADGGTYVPPEGVKVDDGELTEDELLRLTGSATATPAADAEDATSSPAAAPARPATPGATGNTTAQPVPPNQNGPAQNRPNAIDPESDRETAPSPLPGAIPVQPGGRPGNQSPNPPSGNPPSGPQDRDDRGCRSSAIPGPAEWRFGMDHAAQRDNLVAFMAAPEPEDAIPLSQEAQFAVGLHRFIGLPDPKEVNGKKLRMLPPRHDAEGKPITDGLAKASQYVAALADDFGVDRAVRMTQLALNDGLKDGKKPLRVDGDFGPVSKQQLRQTIMDGGYEAFGRAIRRRFGEEYATKART